jgi:anti-anti-sigma factor
MDMSGDSTGPHDERARSDRTEAQRPLDALRADSAQAIRRSGELVITARRLTAKSYLVLLAGELDAAARPAAEEELAGLRCDGRDITLDLSELEFLDSSGLRYLLDLTHAQDGASPVRLVSASAAVRRLAELTGTTSRLGI